MRYLPICARYGQLPYYALWIALPYVAMATGHLYFALFYLNSYLLFGICVEHGVASYLKKKRVGMRRGTRLLNWAQVAGVVAAVVLGIGVQRLGELYLPDDLKPARSVARSMDHVATEVEHIAEKVEQMAEPVERLTSLHTPHTVPLHHTEPADSAPSVEAGSEHAF